MGIRAFFRRRFVNAPRAERVDLQGRRVIVTGASPGSIGFETAKILASWGAHVVITTRSKPEQALGAIASSLGSGDWTPHIDANALDLSRPDSVEAFTRWYLDRHGERLDILVNNAGIHLDLLSQWKEPKLSEDGYEIQWRTNYLGTMHLTHRLLPYLENTGQLFGEARVVNVVSQLYAKGATEGLFAPHEPYDSWVAYGTSKLALVHATNEIQRRFAEASNLQAYCLHPGAVFTNVASKGLAGNRLVEAVRNALAPIERFFLLSPEEGAQTSLYCATKPGLRGGRYFRECQATPTGDAANDEGVAKRLWMETQSWVNP